MIVLTLAMLTSAAGSYKIVDIERSSAFAGKLGREVRETWKVTRDSDEFSVIVMPYHTHVARTPSFQVGDNVVIHSAPRGRTLRVTLREVSK